MLQSVAWMHLLYLLYRHCNALIKINLLSQILLVTSDLSGTGFLNMQVYILYLNVKWYYLYCLSFELPKSFTSHLESHQTPLRVKQSLLESSGGRGNRTRNLRPCSYQSLWCQFEDGQAVGIDDKATWGDIDKGGAQSMRKCDGEVTAPV